MNGFLVEHWIEVLFSLIAAGALGMCKYAFSQLKNYKKLLEEQDQDIAIEMIKKELQPIFKEIELIKTQLQLMEQKSSFQFEAITESYKFRLINLCKEYLDQGFITTKQFDQLSEMHKLYHKLGGNDQGDEYYEKAKRLPIKDE